MEVLCSYPTCSKSLACYHSIKAVRFARNEVPKSASYNQLRTLSKDQCMTFAFNNVGVEKLGQRLLRAPYFLWTGSWQQHQNPPTHYMPHSSFDILCSISHNKIFSSPETPCDTPVQNIWRLHTKLIYQYFSAFRFKGIWKCIMIFEETIIVFRGLADDKFGWRAKSLVRFDAYLWQSVYRISALENTKAIWGCSIPCDLSAHLHLIQAIREM